MGLGYSTADELESKLAQLREANRSAWWFPGIPWMRYSREPSRDPTIEAIRTAHRLRH